MPGSKNLTSWAWTRRIGNAEIVYNVSYCLRWRHIWRGIVGMLRNVHFLMVTLLISMAMSADHVSAKPIIISKPKVTIARARDVIPEYLFPKASARGGPITEESLEAAKNEPVILIEFSSNADLRKLARREHTLVEGRGYLCSKNADAEPAFEADIIADTLDWLLPLGDTAELLYAFMPRANFNYRSLMRPVPAGRYVLYFGKDSTEAINLRAGGKPIPANARLDTLTEDLCIRIEVYRLHHPLVLSEAMRVPHTALQEAWKAFVASGGLQKSQ